MIEQEQVQVTQADRDAAEALRGSPAYALGFYDHTPLVQAFARHRHTATAEALEAMREAQEALAGLVSFERPVGAGDGRTFTMSVPAVSSIDKARQAFTRLTAAIAKIEGDAECDGRALAALTYQDGQRSAPDGGN